MELLRPVVQASGLAAVWWYGRWLLDPPAELPFDQSLLVAGITVIVFIAYAALTAAMLGRLTNRWSAGILEGREAEIARLLLSFGSLLFLGIFLLLSLSNPWLGLAAVFGVSFLYTLIRMSVRDRLV